MPARLPVRLSVLVARLSVPGEAWLSVPGEAWLSVRLPGAWLPVPGVLPVLLLLLLSVPVLLPAAVELWSFAGSPVCVWPPRRRRRRAAAWGGLYASARRAPRC